MVYPNIGNADVPQINLFIYKVFTPFTTPSLSLIAQLL